MVVQVEKQVAVLPQPLLKPGALLVVEFDDVVGDGPLGLAHSPEITPRRRRKCSDWARAVESQRT